MSRQRKAIPGIIRQLSHCSTGVGLVVGGSVRYGYERPDSDLDLFGISDGQLELVLRGFAVVSEKNGGRLLESRTDGFPVHIAYWPRAGFDRVLRERPYMTYPILDGEIVYDPDQTMGPYTARMREYFDARPQLTRAWATQLAALRDFKTGRIGGLAFPEWSDFLHHIEETELHRSAERAGAAGASSPHRPGPAEQLAPPPL